MATLGIDCGRVIFYPLGGEVPGAVDALRRAVDAGRFDAIHIVSRASYFNRAYFRLRLRHMRFWERTGIPRANLHFVFRNRGKAGVCEKFGITDFVDDRLDVLRHLRTVPRRYALAPSAKELTELPGIIQDANIARSWDEMAAIATS